MAEVRYWYPYCSQRLGGGFCTRPESRRKIPITSCEDGSCDRRGYFSRRHPLTQLPFNFDQNAVVEVEAGELD